MELECSLRLRWHLLLRLAQAASLCVLAATTNAEAQVPQPRLFEVTKRGEPGDLIALTGSDFGAQPQVFVDRIDTTSDLPGGADLVQLTDLLTVSPIHITATLPRQLAPGLYAVFVRVPEAVSQSTSGYSNYLFVNAAEPWSTLDLAGTEANGSAPFRLFGWNLSVPSATPSVRLLDPSTGSYIPVPNVAKTPNPYTLQVSLSGIANLVDGQAYRVFVSNGLVPNATSVSNGEVEGPTLFYTTLGAANRRALHVIRWPPAPPTSQLLKCPTLMIIGGTGSPHGSHLRSQSPSNALRAVSSGRKSDRSALEKRRKPWCS